MEHSKSLYVYWQGKIKCTVCLSGHNKAAKRFHRQRVAQWVAELKYTVLVMSYLNSEFILLGITQKRGSGQHWQKKTKHKLYSSFCLAARRLSPSSGDTVGPGEIVWATACICGCNNSFVNNITSLPVFAYLAAVNMLAALYHSPCACTGQIHAHARAHTHTHTHTPLYKQSQER